MAVICCSISGSGPGAGRQAGRDKFIASYGDRFKVRITAPPVDGKANAHLNCFLAKAFGVGRNDVTLVKDSSTKSKGFRIHKPQKFPKSLAFAVTGERTG
ncbi:MAG: DUF167 family protein [Sedimenticolaceae bacterium]|uniref:DUF167 family protein n=1 Tax=Candidatus Vondammii sp. HM_W22 TaxID=2687299 RepID=UPI001F13C5C2|nr:DUF167 family protein [Candidatus Vondammii sp. HM_W22]